MRATAKHININFFIFSPFGCQFVLCSFSCASRFQSLTFLLNGTHYDAIYVQFNIAFPLTFGEVFCTPLLTVICRSAGAVAVIVVDPGRRHVASPVPSIVATP
jgi:hypothetical protein